ncbi:MAG: ATP-dependent helicase [Nanoarchaeota archaeon]|nr:ATP-dependent helicase [Nanoarchaeota archaeon]
MTQKEPIKLNKEQQEAVNTIDGNLLIIASAGTGKTTTIIERYVNLVQNHQYKPNEIMMTTFTNKASKDMIRKIVERTGSEPPYMGTMHSLFLKILRSHARSISLDPEFTLIHDEYDKRKIMKKIIIGEGIPNKPDNVNYFLFWISKFKNRGVLAEDLSEKSTLDDNIKQGVIEEILDDDIIQVDPNLRKYVNKIYKIYEQELKKINSIDLDDILLLTFKILDKNPEIKERYSHKFKAIMVDEAQDLNVVQINILELLKNNNICLIGDDCQNIYEWRGSSNKLVFEFDKTAKKVILKENYRSTKKIITAVNKTINSFTIKIDKNLICTRESGKEILVESFHTFDYEIKFIVHEIKKLIKNNIQKEDIAVLFRTNNMGKQIEKEFRRNKILCHLSKSRSFFEREEVRDIISLLKLKQNYNSLYDFERIINLLPNFGESKIHKLKEISINYKCSLVNSLDYSDELKLNEDGKYNLNLLKDLLSSKENPLKLFLKTFNYLGKIINKYKDDPEKLEDKLENIKLIEGLFEEYSPDLEGIKNFLDSLIELEKKEKDRDKIVLTTIHSAKGLEWKYVFLAGCNEKILPFYVRSLTPLKRDSELRLFYVAISRAKDFLIITYSDNHHWKELDPSHFIEIIN